MPVPNEAFLKIGQGLWIDYADYAARLLLADKPDWLAIENIVAWVRQSQALLKSQVILLNVEEVADAWLSRDRLLATAMSERSRVGFPLRTLLASVDFRAHLQALFSAVGESMDKTPLLAVVPSPRIWVAHAYAQAFPEMSAEIDDDAVDTAASYIADLLRELPQSRVAGVIIDTTGQDGALSAEELALYQPIFNVAQHYRWPTAVLTAGQVPPPAGEGLNDFWIAGRLSGVVAGGAIVPDLFWKDGDIGQVDAEASFRYVKIPVDAHPEAVLERLAALQSLSEHGK